MAVSASTTSRRSMTSRGERATAKSSEAGMPSPHLERAPGAERLTRRHACALLTAAGLVRCGSNADIDFTTLKELYTRSSQPSSVTREDAARIPYASAGLRID